MRARDILAPGGPLATSIEGYEHREGQLQMADAVEDALGSDGVLLVEAGTGTGKTWAYLIPALLSGRKVVISTGTKTLQDQIMEHDVPLLEEHLGVSVEAACMKGLENYLCLRRYHELLQSERAVEGPSARWLPVLQQWEASTVTGDRAEITSLPDDAPIWSEVHSGSDTRIGPRCRYYEDCYITRMRAAAQQAQIVVVNHHLFFADLALRGPHGGGVLPEYDAVIFDEAHRIEDVATQFFGVSMSTTRLERFVRDVRRALATAHIERDADPLLDGVLVSSTRFFDAVPRPGPGEPGRVPLGPEGFTDTVQRAMFDLDNHLDGLAALCLNHADRSEAVAQMARRAQQIRSDLALIAEGHGGGRVTWSERRGQSVHVGASPVEVGGILREPLFEHGQAVVMTSATLAVGGSFHFIKQRLGIDFEVEQRVVESPFDYARQAALYLPRGLPDPRHPGFRDAVAEHVRQLVEMTDGGAFVLCTSVAAMRELAERARRDAERPVLLQGEAPNAHLIERFRREARAVLFATASFWQGVDVPGHALRLVVIDKLPFDVPNDPLVEARCARLREAGVEPFMRYLVPAAALSLKQGFGRLVRSQRDRGIVAILDRRLTEKGYGKVFLRSLPEARRCHELRELAAFFKGEQ